MKDYYILAGTLNKRLQGGFLAKCVGSKEGKDLLEKVHDASCGDASMVSLNRRIQIRAIIGKK